MVRKVFSRLLQFISTPLEYWRASKRYSLARRLDIVWNTVRLEWTYFRKKTFFVRRVHGHKMRLNVRRAGVGYGLAIWGDREELDTFIAKQGVLPGMNVVDLGANVGYYTLLMANQVGDKGRVNSLEPFPDNYQDLIFNVESNKLKSRVSTRQIAVSDQKGEATFFVGEGDNLGSLYNLRGERNPNPQQIVVKTTTLDELAKDIGPIDFLRMDIEGAETLVFDGMNQVFKQAIPPRILFEVHPTGDVDPDPRFTPHFERLLDVGYLPRYLISSANPTAKQRFKDLGYTAMLNSRDGQSLFADILPEHLVLLGARRPKVVRSIFLVHFNDRRVSAD
ncbi:MAG: FkbM family methyltransferase [Anaerolineales bacterium]|nr:MAG: FkbM family methyltransferase [Anaerolineales bacterium]